MEKTQAEINKEIRARFRDFNIDDSDEGLRAIDQMMGEGDPPASEEDYNGDTPLASALTLLAFRETDAWAEILQGVENIKNDLKKKSEDMNLGRDSRLSSLDALQGIAAVMAFIGGAFHSAEERANRLSTDEKLLVGPEGMKVVKEAKAPEVVSKKPEKPVMDQTTAAIAFLEKGAN